MIVVLDTAGIDAFAARPAARARLRTARRDLDDIVVPAAVLAEGVLTGRPTHDVGVHRLLGEASVEPVTERIGLAAGTLRVGTMRDGIAPPPSGVDAIVAAVADQLAADDDVVIVTSDAEDLRALTQHAEHAVRLSIERV